jgi:hypothetical protein
MINPSYCDECKTEHYPAGSCPKKAFRFVPRNALPPLAPGLYMVKVVSQDGRVRGKMFRTKREGVPFHGAVTHVLCCRGIAIEVSGA